MSQLNEDYVVVWLGIEMKLRDSAEADSVREGHHPVAERARAAGLQILVDSFDHDTRRGEVYSVLIGRELASLGYKRGEFLKSVDINRLQRESEEIGQLLVAAGLPSIAGVHVAVLIQE